MARKRRNGYDGMAISHLPRWYVVYDAFRAVLEYELLPPGADLWAVLREVMETRARRGWEIEVEHGEPRYGNFFCRKGADRLFITIQPTDPNASRERYFSPFGPSQTAPVVHIQANTADRPEAALDKNEASSGSEEAQTPPANRHLD